MRPPYLPRAISCIIVCVTSSLQEVSMQTHVDHFTTTIDNLLTKYPDAGVTILGDTNDLDLQPLLRNNCFKQVVNQPTRGDNILDKIVTNYSHFYSGVSTLSPIGRSDHNCVLWTPLSLSKSPQDNIKKKVVRPLKDSGIRALGQWITHHSWDSVLDSTDVSTKCATLITTVQTQLDVHLATNTSSEAP